MSHKIVSIRARRPKGLYCLAEVYSNKLSFIKIATTLLIVTCFIATQTTHLQALAAASVSPTAVNTNQQQHQQLQQRHQSNYLNYLLYHKKQQQVSSVDQLKLEKLLKDTNHSHVSDTISLQLADSIWKQMHDNALNFAQDSAQQARPSINQILDQSGVGLQCKHSINDILDHLAQLDEWAVAMYNSFGDFPATGFFEGSFTSMGSYHQCVNVQHNEWIGRPQYCTLKFQPIVPKRPKYHNILAKIDNLANFTSKNDVSNRFGLSVGLSSSLSSLPLPPSPPSSATIETTVVEFITIVS